MKLKIGMKEGTTVNVIHKIGNTWIAKSGQVEVEGLHGETVIDTEKAYNLPKGAISWEAAMDRLPPGPVAVVYGNEGVLSTVKTIQKY